MESDILNALKFEVGNPTTKTFLRYITNQINLKNVAWPHFCFQHYPVTNSGLSVSPSDCRIFIRSDQEDNKKVITH
jgi:hypothetical protein